MAEKLFASEASLSRFAKKCGFKGYREFICQYGENFMVKQEAMTGNIRLILNAYQELMNKAARVFVCGMGSSGLVAREMELRFMRIGVDITSMGDRDMMRMGGVPG